MQRCTAFPPWRASPSRPGGRRLPALAGVVRFIEAESAIARVLETVPAENRFRQSVGVAVKLKMAKLGWRTTGRKGTVKGSRHFTKAERYVFEPQADNAHATRALSALEAVTRVGDDRERDRTGRELMDALAATRREQGRPF